MKAITYEKYGSPDVLSVEEVQKPTPKDDEVLIKVRAASVNPFDWHYLRGEPFFMRLMGAGILKPRNKILGIDIAGRVEAGGGNVKQFQPGDEVFGASDFGALAEYVCAKENALVLKPANVTSEEAAAAPVAALTALQALRDKGEIQPGQKVLINGASGGVGTFAVQIAKSYGAAVTGVCSTGNLEMVRSIGTDHVIDYGQEDFTRNGQRYDLILDAVANRSFSDLKRALGPRGICVIVGFSPALTFQVFFPGPWKFSTGDKKIGMMSAKITKEDLDFLKDLLEAGKVVPVIDRRYPLDEAADALRYLEEGHAKGKIVINIEQDAKT